MAKAPQRPRWTLGPVVFASDDSAEAVDDAKAYIRRFGLTHDDVRIARVDGQTLVLAKRNISSKIKSDTPPSGGV